MSDAGLTYREKIILKSLKIIRENIANGNKADALLFVNEGIHWLDNNLLKNKPKEAISMEKDLEKTRFKYCYVDVLSAAWMAYHFKMKFFDENGDSAYPFEDLYNTKRPKKYYIHINSLTIIEPKIGDLCFDEGHLPNPYREYGYDEVQYPKPYTKIIQRDGMPFHWPVIEEVINQPLQTEARA